MHGFETTSITVPYQRRCEDRVAVIEFPNGVILAVADGAGGTGDGGQAAETVIRELTAAASLEHESTSWCRILREIDYRISDGESTCVVVACTHDGIFGASVGDSRAWLIENGALTDLTTNQHRKPLLCSGDAEPVGIEHAMSDGLLIIGTDGFCNYVRRDVLLQKVIWIDFAVLARNLVDLVRLPSGALWDDIGIVACRRRRPVRGRQRYNIMETD